jgi:ketosteroid isomerase-like protein
MKKMILGTALATALALPAILGQSNAVASGSVHPDCIDNPNPGQCDQIVAEMQEVLADYIQAHSDGDVEAMMSYFTPGVVIGSWGQFYRGHASYRDDFLVPLMSTINSAELYMSPMRFQVISPNLVILYGYPIVTLNNKDGSTVTFSERGLMVWTKNPGDPDARYALAAATWDVE